MEEKPQRRESLPPEGGVPLILLTDSHKDSRKPRRLSTNEGDPRRARLFLHQQLVRERESGVNDPQVPVNPSGHPLPPLTPPVGPSYDPLQGKRERERAAREGRGEAPE